VVVVVFEVVVVVAVVAPKALIACWSATYWNKKTNLVRE